MKKRIYNKNIKKINNDLNIIGKCSLNHPTVSGLPKLNIACIKVHDMFEIAVSMHIKLVNDIAELETQLRKTLNYNPDFNISEIQEYMNNNELKLDCKYKVLFKKFNKFKSERI